LRDDIFVVECVVLLAGNVIANRLALAGANTQDTIQIKDPQSMAGIHDIEIVFVPDNSAGMERRRARSQSVKGGPRSARRGFNKKGMAVLGYGTAVVDKRDADALIEAGARVLLGVVIPAHQHDFFPVELAAWTEVTRAILNLHETITRE